MKNTKLIEVLRKMTARERRRVEEWLASPFFCKREKLQQLWAVLKPFAPAFDDPKLQKEWVYLQIYGPGAVYQERQLNNLLSDLLKQLYRYLSYLQLEAQPVLEKNLLLEALLERELTKHLDGVSKQVQTLQERGPERSFQFYHHWYQYFEYMDQAFLMQQARGYDVHLQSLDDHFNRYFWINKLRIACGMLSRNTVIKAAYECRFLAPVEAHLDQHPELLDQEPALAIYYNALQLLEKGMSPAAEQSYRELKECLQQHANCLPAQELYSVYNYALNYCIRQINSGNSQYYPEILDLYKALLGRGILLLHNHLNQWTYKNIVTAGIRSQEFEWTQAFIQDYQEYLSPEEKEHAVAYNRAMLFQAQGAYREALQQLQSIEFSYPFYHAGAKTIQLQIYYDLGETEAFFALAEAFHKYIYRNRSLSDYHKQSNLHFLKLSRKIYELQLSAIHRSKPQLQQRWAALQQQLEELAPIANKSWLEEKLRALKPH